MSSKQSAPTPKRTRLSYKDKAAIIEAANKGGRKEAVRDKMMSEYKIGGIAYYSRLLVRGYTLRHKTHYVM